MSLHVTVTATSSIRNRSYDWKLQNNHEKRRKERTKQFYRNLLVGNLEKLGKNRQVCLICHINVKRSQETGNRQTNKQTDKVL